MLERPDLAHGVEMSASFQFPEGAEDPRLVGLRRMRAVATLLLVLMAIVFVATTALKLDWPWIPYVRAFSEAGMVGACADWFAIVALFRRPFGLPIPHTEHCAEQQRSYRQGSRTFHHQ